MKVKGNIVFALVLLGITLFFVLGSLSYDPLARQLPLLVGLLYLRLKEKLWVSLVVAAVMWVVAYVGFIQLMEVPLFKGILWD